MTIIKVILQLPLFFNILGLGVLEYWSNGVLKKIDIIPLSNTPTLQHSNTPKLIQFENSHHRLTSSGLQIRGG
jgi:hypothetical protein